MKVLPFKRSILRKIKKWIKMERLLSNLYMKELYIKCPNCSAYYLIENKCGCDR